MIEFKGNVEVTEMGCKYIDGATLVATFDPPAPADSYRYKKFRDMLDSVSAAHTVDCWVKWQE